MTLTVEHHDPSNHGSVIEDGTTVFTGPLSDCWAYVQIKERDNLLTIIDRLETSLEEIAGLPIDPDDPLVTTRKMVKIAMDAYDRARQPDPLKKPDSTEVVAYPQTGEKYRKKPVVVSAFRCVAPMSIETLEGVMQAEKGDYIITGVKGERYPCKPDIFEATYERVEEDQAEVVGPDWSQAPEWAKAWVVNDFGRSYWLERADPRLCKDTWEGGKWKFDREVNHPNWRESLTKRPECGRSHPHENMNQECERLTVAARENHAREGKHRQSLTKRPESESGIPVTEQNQELMVPDRPAATLRDRFAMAALTGLISSPNWGANLSATVADAYKFADALLADRDQGGSDE